MSKKEIYEISETNECISKRHPTRNFLTEFIELYKGYPCLWQRSCIDYHNKRVKEKAYNILLEKWHEHNPKGTMDHVKCKIQNLRSIYIRELRRVELARQSGEVLVPSLWYFDLLSFISKSQYQDIEPEDFNCLETADDAFKDDNYDRKERRERHLIIELIKVYKQHPSLWEFDHKDYKRNTVTTKGFDALLEKAREFHPKAQMRHVKAKINNLRAYILRVARKVRRARIIGAEPYIPKLWYYDMFKFILPEEQDSKLACNVPSKNNSLDIDRHEEISSELGEGRMDFEEDSIGSPEYSQKSENMIRIEYDSQEIECIENYEDIDSDLGDYDSVNQESYNEYGSDHDLNIPTIFKKIPNTPWKRSHEIQLINIYKEHPCLWKKSHKDYNNLAAKAKAYKILLQRMQEFVPNANMLMIKTKINSMEEAFHRETLKNDSSVWYYDLLKFLLCDEENMNQSNLNSNESYYINELEDESNFNTDPSEGGNEEPSEYEVQNMSPSEEPLETFDVLETGLGICDTRRLPRKFLIEFIEMYKSNQCLWLKSHKDYKNFFVRQKAYKALLDKWHELDPQAVMEHVAIKISSLRTVCIKEYKRIQEFKKSGEDYMPSLWYYGLMKFIFDQDEETIEEPADITYEKTNNTLAGGVFEQPIWRRSFKIEFINLYKHSPCLWKEDHMDFTNNRVKKRAITALLEKVRKIYPKAQRKEIIIKLRKMKQTVLKEAAQVEESKLHGEQPYIPAIWYYDMFKFLLPDKQHISNSNTIKKITRSNISETNFKENFHYDVSKGELFADQDSVDPLALTTKSQSESVGTYDDFERDVELPRQFLIDFIDIYKEQTCLWRKSCKSYYDTEQRKISYKKLLNKWYEYDSEATIELVIREVKNLRQNVRKEFAREEQAEMCGETYNSPLWYYNNMKFIYKYHDELQEETTDVIDDERATAEDISNSKTWPKSFKIEFINIFKQYPCLWKPTHMDYHINTAAKEEAFNVLLEKLREIYPQTQMEQVIAKVKKIRNVFYKAICNAKKSKTCAKEIENSIPIKNSPKSEEIEDTLPYLSESAVSLNYDSTEDNHSIYTEICNEKSMSENLTINPVIASTSNKRKRSVENDLSSSSENDEVLNSNTIGDCYDTYGKHIGNKLRALDKVQNVYAQKLINDIIYAAELKELDRTARIVIEQNK